MPFRIAILGIYHESNTFIKKLVTSEDFRNGLYIGDSIREVFASAHHEIGGMLEVLDGEGMEVVPVFFAYATPGGRIESDTCIELIEELFDQLEHSLPVDACLVVPHGAAVGETINDLDGYWLAALRKRMGNTIPIIGTLDPHANLSQQMVNAVNCFVAYQTNPHVDQRETGAKAARILLDMLKQKIRPCSYLCQLPLAISIEQQQTAEEPCLGIYGHIRFWLQTPQVVSISLLLGFPYADVEEMGTSVLVVTDNDANLARRIAFDIKAKMIERIDSFSGVKLTFDKVKNLLPILEKPILLLDMGDNIGAGSPGNSTNLLKDLCTLEEICFFYCLYDPFTVDVLSGKASGSDLVITLVPNYPEHKFECQAKLVQTVNGEFYESNARHGGQMRYDMGTTVLLQTTNGSVIMLTSKRVMPFSLQQLLGFDLFPGRFDVIVAKGVNAPIAAYGEVCSSILKVDTPGATQADVTGFQYNNRRKPMFPFETVKEVLCL